MPPDVITGLANQLDLQQLPSEGDALVFKTRGALARPTSLPGSTPSSLRILLLAAELLGIWFLILMLLRRRREEKRKERHSAVMADQTVQFDTPEDDILQRQIVSTLVAKYKKDTGTDQEARSLPLQGNTTTQEPEKSDISGKDMVVQTDIPEDNSRGGEYNKPLTDTDQEIVPDMEDDKFFGKQAAKKNRKKSGGKSGTKAKSKTPKGNDASVGGNEDAVKDDRSSSDTSNEEGKETVKGDTSVSEADTNE